MDKPKPCPFCGGKATITQVDRFPGNDYPVDKYAYFLRCQSCACEGPWSKSETSATRLWNTRPITLPLTPNIPAIGKNIMVMEVDVEPYPGTDSCFIVWYDAEPIGTVGSTNNDKYDITAHFEKVEDERKE